MNYRRPAALQDFLSRLEDFIEDRVQPREAAGLTARKVFTALQSVKSEAPAAAPRHFPVCDRLDDAIALIPPAQEECRAVAQSLKALARALPWSKRQGLAAGPEFEPGHANAMIVGPGGIEVRQDVWAGVSLMAPHVTYPDHRHPPEEVYAVLSPGEWRQGDGAWWEPGIGGILHNSSNIVHAMRSGEHCLLAVWCLHLG